jgi:hypothetical protein
MSSSRRSGGRSQGKPKKPSRASNRRKSSKAGAATSDLRQSSKHVVRRRPLVELCERSGWSVQFLNRTPSSEEDLGDLCVRELIACREAGYLSLAIALADAALEAGLNSPRISANRTRALRAQARESNKSAVKAAVTAKGLRSRLKRMLFPNHARTVQPKVAQAQHSGQQVERVENTKALKALRHVCRSEGWTPQFLDASASGDIALACAREMQRCRQEGRHALVVALAAEAALQNVAHPRIQDNLNRSQAKAQLGNLRKMLDGDRAAMLSAEVLLIEALIDNPDHQEYRKLLAECIGRQLESQSGFSIHPELRQSAVNLEISQRLLRALQRRRNDSASQT